MENNFNELRLTLVSEGARSIRSSKTLSTRVINLGEDFISHSIKTPIKGFSRKKWMNIPNKKKIILHAKELGEDLNGKLSSISFIK